MCTGAPIFITEDCVDPLYTTPEIDVQEWRDEPARHFYVNGHFERPAPGEAEPRFSFYFPEEDRYEGRFFHFVNAIPGGENTSDRNIEFGVGSGAYFVQTNGGGGGTTAPLGDSTIPGYRVDAAAAKFSRVVAADLYGYAHRPHGYNFGGSGGGFKTIAGAENTRGVWDGTVPFVIGSPMAIPNVYSVRGHALRHLRRENACAALVDAVEPGGSGDIYAGLSQEAAAALEEATRFGFPPRAWFECETMGLGALPLVFPLVVALDPGYFVDFWAEPGYLGADPGASIQQDRVLQFATSVVERLSPGHPDLPPGAFLGGVRLSAVPASGDLSSFEMTVTVFGQDHVVPMFDLVGDVAAFSFTADFGVVFSIMGGEPAILDNSNALAMQTYHRHQDPAVDRGFGFRDDDFRVWDQFRDGDGNPLFPQRPILSGPFVTGTGTTQNGQINGKVIVVETLMDIDALPWQADWYRTKVEQQLGKDLDDEFRLYYIDNADHGSTVSPSRQTHLVGYRPVLEQALRDVAAWAEQGIKPPASTKYEMVDGLPVVPAQAGKRKGVQPVVELTVNGGERAEVGVGEAVTFRAKVQVPQDSGQVVSVEWDLEGGTAYPVTTPLEELEPVVVTEMTHSYSEPGTYFPAVRATSQRDGDTETPFARIQNLDRVRVVVHE